MLSRPCKFSFCEVNLYQYCTWANHSWGLHFARWLGFRTAPFRTFPLPSNAESDENLGWGADLLPCPLSVQRELLDLHTCECFLSLCSKENPCEWLGHIWSFYSFLRGKKGLNETQTLMQLSVHGKLFQVIFQSDSSAARTDCSWVQSLTSAT